MKKIVLGASFALTAAFSAAISPIQSVDAKPIDSSASFFTAQTILGEESITPESEEVLTPTLDPITETADYYAFVDSFDGQTLYARLPDGTTQPFTLPEGTGGAENYDLNPGDLVAINAGKDNVISGLDNPVIDSEFIGEVTSYDGGELVATSVTGEVRRTPVSESLISRLELQPGDEVRMTSFQNIEGMSSICKVKRAELPPAAPATAPEVFTPPAPPPEVAPVIKGLW